MKKLWDRCHSFRDWAVLKFAIPFARRKSADRFVSMFEVFGVMVEEYPTRLLHAQGAIPTEIGQLTAMIRCLLSDNKLNGESPFAHFSDLVGTI